MAPVSATRKVSRGGPPIAAQCAAGEPAWLIASRPHGNAYGQRARMASAATHQAATATGQPGSRSSSRWPMASTPKITASATASAIHAYQATLTSQEISGTKNARPKSRPRPNAVRSRCACSATTSSAGPTAASGQNPIGGNAPTRARPPAVAASRAQPSRSRAGPAGAGRATTGRARPALATAPRWLAIPGLRCIPRA